MRSRQPGPAYRPDAAWPLKVTNDFPDKDGWTNIRNFSYQTSPNEKRDVGVTAQRANDTWTVIIYDMTQAVGEKRGAQVALIFGRLFPKGYSRESLRGQDGEQARRRREIAALSAFIESGPRRRLACPASRWASSRTARSSSPAASACASSASRDTVDADTLFMIASNTKALTTLMLAKLVDEGKLTWDTPVTKLLPSFKLGDADTTSQVLVKHLICACTGLPRQDLEWLFEFKDADARERAGDARRRCSRRASSARCSSTRTRSRGAAGFVGGHVAFPKLELGAGVRPGDAATRVFDPLGMTSTTFDYARALAGNHATLARAGRRRKARARGDGPELLDHPAASRWRRRGATSATC